MLFCSYCRSFHLFFLTILFSDRSRTSSLFVIVAATAWTRKTPSASSAWGVKVVRMSPWSCPSFTAASAPVARVSPRWFPSAFNTPLAKQWQQTCLLLVVWLLQTQDRDLNWPKLKMWIIYTFSSLVLCKVLIRKTIFLELNLNRLANQWDLFV